MELREEDRPLIESALGFAEHCLMRHGAFYPYAVARQASGDIAHVAGFNGADRPLSEDVLDLLRKGLRREAAQSACAATAIVSDQKVTHPETGASTDAVTVDVETRAGDSLRVFFPYTIARRGILRRRSVAFGEIFATDGPRQIFVGPLA